MRFSRDVGMAGQFLKKYRDKFPDTAGITLRHERTTLVERRVARFYALVRRPRAKNADDDRRIKLPPAMEAKSVTTFASGGPQLRDHGFYEISGLAWSGRGRIRGVDGWRGKLEASAPL